MAALCHVAYLRHTIESILGPFTDRSCRNVNDMQEDNTFYHSLSQNYANFLKEAPQSTTKSKRQNVTCSADWQTFCGKVRCDERKPGNVGCRKIEINIKTMLKVGRKAATPWAESVMG